MRTSFFHVTAALSLLLCVTVQATDFLWLEAEKNPQADFEWEAQGAEIEGVLSEGKWLTMKERPKSVPDDGWNVAYKISIDQPGDFNLWLRIGYEKQRPGVYWKIDEGAWTKVGPPPMQQKDESYVSRHKFDRHSWTTNVKELGWWQSVAWWNLGSAALSKGEHTLHFKFVDSLIPNPLLGLDAVCLVKGKWTPDGKLKPGEIYQGETDLLAAKKVYELPPPPAGVERVQVDLTGPWQLARYDDPDMDVDTWEPVRRIPSPEEYDLKWLGVSVPHKDLWEHPELSFAHRVIYRTRVNVPAEHDGRGFRLHFSGTNWITSVFINGQFAGDRKSVWIPWDLDVSRLIKPGAVNELAVVVKGHYYAFDPGSHHLARKSMNCIRDLPYSIRIPRGHPHEFRFVAPIFPSINGDGDGYVHGIVNPVYLVSVGRTYVEDVFIKPSVAKQSLDAEVTVRNMGDADAEYEVRCEAVYDPDKTNTSEKSFGPVRVKVPAGKTETVNVGGAWASPKLWWPEPKPHLYRMRTRVLRDGRDVDVQETLFGFREVTVKDTGIYINGTRRNLWNWMSPSTSTPGKDWIERWRNEGNRFLRFTYANVRDTGTRCREEYLEMFDREGVPGLLCSMIDGSKRGSFLWGRWAEPDGAGVRQFVPNEPVWANLREHIAQMVRAYRNHPSVLIYQLDNKLVYSSRGENTDVQRKFVAAEAYKLYLAGMALDSTRPYCTGGGGDLRFAHGSEGRRLPVSCLYNPAAAADWYPDDAYQLTQFAVAIPGWVWDRANPWIAVEDQVESATDLGTYAAGPAALHYAEEARRGKARFTRALFEGYRWSGVAAFASRDNLSEFEDGRKAFSALTVIPRKRAYRLEAGKENKLQVKVMNDTFSREPVTLEWQYRIEGRAIAGDTQSLAIEPGLGQEHWLRIPAPSTPRRLDGILNLKVSMPGQPAFEDSLSIPVLPAAEIRVAAPVLVYDKPGATRTFLAACGVPLAEIKALPELADRSGLLIIGHDTLSADEASGAEVHKFAARGNQVICLEQDHPLAKANLPTPIKATDRFGSYAHPEALGTPLFAELTHDDFADWAGEHPTYKNAYARPATDARSLMECGTQLACSALVECRAGDGFMLLCQLRVGAKLGVEPAAGILLRNMIATYAGRKLASDKAALFAPTHSVLGEKVKATGVLHEPAADLRQALNVKAYRAVIVDGSPESLKTLLALKDAAQAYQEQGGWIMVCGVSPQSLNLFNQFMDTSHLLRPFRVERVYIEKNRHPLAATLHDALVVQYGTTILHSWWGTYWLSPDVYSWIIDTHDAAPFTLPPGAADDPYAYDPARKDQDPYNVVNGMLTADAPQYGRVFRVLKDGDVDVDGTTGPTGLEQTFRVRRPETIRQVNIWNNTKYSSIEKLDILFDNDPASAVSTILPDNGSRHEVALPRPMTANKTITLAIRSWRQTDKKLSPEQRRLVGLDNVQFIRDRHASHGIALDNIGGLTIFPRKQGGVLLNQVKYMSDADEPNLENARKKVDLTRTILQNMGLGCQASLAIAGPAAPAGAGAARVGDWPGFAGPRGDCTAPDVGLLAKWPAEGPRELWTVKVGEGYGGVAVRDGEVYLLDRDGEAADVLRCFELASGKEKWALRYDARIKLPHPGSRSHPAVDEKHVFVFSPLGELRCMDRATHQVVWIKECAREVAAEKPTWGFSQTPLLTGDRVIVAPVGKEATAVAYNKATGEVAWKSGVIDGKLGYVSPMLASIGGIDQVLILTSGATAGLDAATGKTLWSSGYFKCSNPIPSPVHLGDGLIFLTGGYRAGCAMLKIRKRGEEFEASPVFKNKNLTSQIHQPIFYQGHIYGNGNEAGGKAGFVCLDLAGDLKWQTGKDPSFDWGGALLADGKIYAVDGSTGDICMIQPNPSGYKEIGRAKFLSGKQIWATIAMADGKILLRDFSNLKCVDVK